MACHCLLFGAALRAALAIGLALQGTLSNVAFGFLLLILRPFNVGEYITAAGQSGTVREIGLFVTPQTLEYYMITLPNTAVLTASITNYSRHPFANQLVYRRSL